MGGINKYREIYISEDSGLNWVLKVVLGLLGREGLWIVLENVKYYMVRYRWMELFCGFILVVDIWKFS